MSRFKHRLKEPFGKAGLTVAVIALVMALVGGAYAAGGLTKSQEKQVTKIAKKYAGKPGATGAPGPAGSAGAAGKEGPQGQQGKQGEQGIQGKQGEPWTAGGTLPKGKTLVGEWNVGGEASAAGKELRNSVSYALPLAAAPITHRIIRPGEGEGEPEENLPAGCAGNVQDPGAEEGNLCVFAKHEENSVKELGPFKLPLVCNWGTEECNFSGEAPGSRIGFGIQALSEGAGVVSVIGTWAVTAK